jgi:hypothetical protein
VRINPQSCCQHMRRINVASCTHHSLLHLCCPVHCILFWRPLRCDGRWQRSNSEKKRHAGVDSGMTCLRIKGQVPGGVEPLCPAGAAARVILLCFDAVPCQCLHVPCPQVHLHANAVTLLSLSKRAVCRRSKSVRRSLAKFPRLGAVCDCRGDEQSPLQLASTDQSPLGVWQIAARSA